MTKALHELPLNGRDISQLILLNPGVAVAMDTGNNSSFVGFAKKYSIGGFRGEDNLFLLDGIELWDWHHRTPAGPSGALLGLETVKEFQTLTSDIPAQYGRLLGGVFNAVSKSGTNQLHGDVFEFLRNSALDARNFFDQQLTSSSPRIPTFRRNQFGATLGGPIKKDKAFFFVAYEGMRQELATTKIINVPDANSRLGTVQNLNGTVTHLTVSPIIAPYLNLYPLPNIKNNGDGTGDLYAAPAPISDSFSAARVDALYDFRQRFSFSSRNAIQFDTTFIVNYPGYYQSTSLDTSLYSLGETHIFSPRAINTFRVHFNRTDSGCRRRGVCPTVAPSLLSVPAAFCRLHGLRPSPTSIR